MELLDLDATGQADLVRRGEVSPVELARASMDAIERLDPQLDAMLHRAFDYALTAAGQQIDPEAPFCGVPAVLKDYGPHVTDFPLSFGALPFLQNPWNPDYSTGGSSSGSAAAVAARLVAIAHGNDGGGSIRLPAGFCGVVGMKPTRGRISVGPDRTEIINFGWSHEFVMTVQSETRPRC